MSSYASVFLPAPPRWGSVLAALLFGILLHLLIAGFFWFKPAYVAPFSVSGVPFQVDVGELASPQSTDSDIESEQEQQEAAAAQKSEVQPAAKPEQTELPPLPQVDAEVQLEQFSETVVESEPDKQTEVEPVEVTDAPSEQQSDPAVFQTLSSINIDTPAQSQQASAPVQGAKGPEQVQAEINWQAMIQTHLERNKRYPRQAQLLRQQGIPLVTFIINRDGYVLDVILFQSSGIASLDEEAIALIKRAEPLPKPPSEITDDPIQLTVPIDFSLRRR